MPGHKSLGAFLNHLVEACNPVADRAVRAAKRVDVGPGVKNVVAREEQSLVPQPDIKLVSGLSRSGDEFKLNAGNLEPDSLVVKGAGWVDTPDRACAFFR